MTGDSAVLFPVPKMSLLFQIFALVIPSKINLPHVVRIFCRRGRRECREFRRAYECIETLKYF